MKGTWKAIVGCILTLGLLAGLVTYLESRLPSELKRAVREEGAEAKAELERVQGLQGQIKTQLEQHPDVLGATAKAERWVELTKLAQEDLVAVQAVFAGELAELVQRNQRDDEPAVIELLDQAFAKREEAMQSIQHLPERVKTVTEILPLAQRAVQELKEHLEADQARIAGIGARLDELVSKEPSLKPVVAREGWREGLAKASRGLVAVEQGRLGAAEQEAKHELEAAKAAIAQTKTLEVERAKAVAGVQVIETRVQTLHDFLGRRASYAQLAAATPAKLDQLPFAAAASGAAAAAKLYPENAAEIERRAKALAFVRTKLISISKILATEVQQPLAEVDLGSVTRLLGELQTGLRAAPQQVAQLRTGLVELDLSSEEALIDMEIKEGYEVTFHQLIRKVSAVRGSPDVKLEESWRKVSEKDYKAWEDKLGLTIAVKPFGYFADQWAKRAASPSGMAYVGNSAYGEWTGDAWNFKTDAATTRLVLCSWGQHYPGVKREELASYAARKQPWIGKDRYGHPLYGSKGSLAALIYAGSRYLTHKGYAQTRYKKSGGSYRGTRYERRSSSSTTVFVGGGSSGSSSRRSSSSYSSRSSSRSSYRSSSGK